MPTDSITRGQASEIYTRLDGHDVELAVHSSYFKLLAAGLSIIGTGVMLLVIKAFGG